MVCQEIEMAVDEAEAFIACVPWRHVKMVPVGHGLTEEEAIERWGELRHIAPDPHEYVIKKWPEVDNEQFDAFVELIKAAGYLATYRAPYRPEYEMRNHYLEIDGWCYWFIRPDMLNRERAEERMHVPLLECDFLNATDSKSLRHSAWCSIGGVAVAPRLRINGR